MYKKKRKHSLISKTIFILILMILPLNIISILIMEAVIENTTASIMTAITSNLKTCTTYLDRKIDNTNYLLYTILESPECIEYLKQADDWTYTFHRRQVYQQSLSDLTLVEAADNMYFYVPAKNDFLFIDNDIRDFLTYETVQEIVTDISFTDGKWHLCHLDDGSAYLIRNIALEKGFYGAIINCQTDLPTFDYNEYSLVFSSYFISQEKNMLSCSSDTTRADCYLTFSIPRNEIIGYVESWKYFLFFISLICLLIIPILFFIFRKNIIRPLNVLNHAHYELQIGNESYQIIADAKSAEFDTAYQAFNNMAQNLQQLRLEKTNRELAYKQMQLTNLQLQIRPHFLLNTMNLLFSLIQSRQTEAAQELVLYLSQYFRYMFRKGKELELFEKELDLIKKYLHISKFHYPDAFTVSYQIDPVVCLLRIPPLLFHNFVENIIQHALLPDRVVHIVLFGEYDNKTVTIQISDDGCGMSEDDILMINNRTFPPNQEGRHIGIRNSITRLDYYFNGQAAIIAESELHNGTTFTITIPCNLDEDNDKPSE